MRIRRKKIISAVVVKLFTSAAVIFAQSPNLHKLSPELQRWSAVQSSSNNLAKVQEPRMTIILKAEASVDLSSIKVRSIVGDVVTAEVSRTELTALLQQQQVRYIQEDKIERLHSYSNAQLMNVAEVHSGIIKSSPLKGDGVILAFYDSGIDWKHMDFRRTDDTTKSRILAIWDQTEAPDAAHSSPANFDYGVEYKQSHLNAELSRTNIGFV
jgi:minor extracellular serine protease Vpr